MKQNVFEMLVESIEQAIAHENGKVKSEIVEKRETEDGEEITTVRLT